MRRVFTRRAMRQRGKLLEKLGYGKSWAGESGTKAIYVKDYKKMAARIGIGELTLRDIVQELCKPGRDPRKAIKVFEFDKNVRTIADLREGMILPGIVGNITNFGAFVDIGIKENGLVHLSQLAERFISDPTEVVSIHQHVMVRVMNVDYDRKRIQLSMIGVQQD